MSLYTRRGRVDVSTSDSEINSVASSGDQSPDEMIEELARMALAGRYYGSPKSYETNEMLRGHGMARHPRASEATAAPSFTSSQPSGSSIPSAGPSPPLSVRRDGLARSPPSGTTLHTSGTPRRTSAPPLRGSARQAEDVDANADVARALARMYRHLAREYATEVKRDDAPTRAVKSKSVGDDGVDGDPSKKKKLAKRGPDEAALARLLTRNKVQEQRQAEKYHKVKERAEEARKHPKRIRVPQKAVVLGKRLHLEAAENQRNVKERQAEAAEQQAAAEKAACTFHPTISRYAERLAAREGHYSIEDRLEDQPLREEERQRLIIDRAVEQEKAFTFHPVLSIGTQELIARQRSRSRHRSRSRTREPFEPGERLYRDGAERLLRQQIRQQRAVSHQQRRVVGGQLRLSAGEAQDVVGRFAAWADARAARNAVRRDETERQARGETSTSPAAAVVHRSPSRRTASTARPQNSPFSSGLEESCAVKEEGWEAQAGQTPTLRSDALSLSASPRQTNRSTGVRPDGGGVVSMHGGSATGSSASFHSGAEESVRDDSAARRDPTRKEQLRVRLGALFYKYAVPPTATTVSPAEVRYQAQCYYPEDVGVADALDAAFDDAEQRLSKVDFMAALARYVAQQGPQTWCMPQRPRGHMQPTSTAASSSVHGGGSDRLATFLERLNAPTSSGGSSSAARQEEDMEEYRPTAPLPQPRASLRSAASSSSSGGVAACAYVTPSGSLHQASRSAPSRSIREAERRSSVSSAAVPVAPLRDLPVPLAEARPLRTHIYTHDGESAAVPERARKEQTALWFAVAAVSPTVDGAATPSTSAQRSFSCTGTQESGRRQQQQQARHSRRCPSRAASLEHVPAVQLVHGYQGHVERHRRSLQCHHNDKTEMDGERRRTREGDCTFTPTLNRHSVALSDVNLERRTLYARELQLRRHELQVLRAAVLQAATNTVAAPAVSTLSSHGATTATDEEDAATVSPAEPLTPPPPRRLVPRPRSPGSGGVGQSPSVDLSSLSSATAQLDCSSSASTVPKALQRTPPPVTPTHQAAALLTEAESVADVNLAVAAPAPSTATTTTLHFHAKRPDNAVA